MGDGLALEEIRSEALRKNMDLTKVDVVISDRFSVFLEAVKGFAGKEQQARELVFEYHHRYRNWQFVVQETWRYAVSNMRLYKGRPFTGSIVHLLSSILLEALKSSERTDVRNLAADHLIAFWQKLLDEMPEEMARPIPEGIHVEELGQSIDESTSCHQGILRRLFLDLLTLPHVPFEHLMRSYYQMKRVGTNLLKIWPNGESFGEFRRLLHTILERTYAFWLQREDPCRWLAQQWGKEVTEASWYNPCSPLSHANYAAYMGILQNDIASETDHRAAVSRMVGLPDFHEIVRTYYRVPEDLKALDDPAQAAELSLLMRLKIMETRGLESIHQDTLREINFDVANWIRQEPPEKLQAKLERIFNVLHACMQNYPEAALQLVRTIGLELIETDDRQLISFFLNRIVEMGFQVPRLGGVSQHWQVEVNPAHLPNIRIWLEIVKKNPNRTRRLLSALIVNLSVGGIYIRDTDLFQKDVSQLLHAPIKPVYNLVKQLAKIFPIYFNQIGAEGQLRIVSTDVDELTGRSDRLIHFLRKQSHVESNNIVVTFIEAIIEFWRTLKKEGLKNLVPEEIYPEIATEGPLVEEVHRLFSSLFQSEKVHHVKDLLDLSEGEVRALLDAVPGISRGERHRAFLLIQFYQLLHEKYALSFKDIHVHLQRAANIGLPDPGALLEALNEGDDFTKLDAILNYLLALQEVILTPSEMNVLENIYYKRHIAVDIPSMYGSYNERKFDALGLTFRLENLANVLFEEIIFSFNLSFITRATFFRIQTVLPFFIKALRIDGITSYRLERQAELFEKALEVRRFSHSQYVDIFRGFSEAIKQIIQTNYYAVHEENLDLVIRQMGRANLLPRYQRETSGESFAESAQRVSESFLRDLIARTFGLQYFDHFITSILTTLAAQSEHLSVENLDLLMSYDPDKSLSLVSRPNPKNYDLIHLGNKGYNLSKLNSLGIKVPPAFVITTEYFRCRHVIQGYPQSREDFEERVMAHMHELETATGKRFGSRSNSLLVSVRSGSAVSMPGMMNTFLNVGINEEIVEGLIEQTGEAWYAWDNYRRFIQSWGMSFGMQRDEFDEIMYHHKKKHGRQVKREFRPEEIRALALAYKDALKRNNIEFSDSPREQLFTAINQVEESWYSPKAKTYRDIMGLSEDWGTAVTIQTMVFGNLHVRSGAGVMFTHNPWTSEDQVDPVGDFTMGNQGEDVVGGLVKTLPLNEKQRLGEREPRDYSLEVLFPRVYQRLVKIAKDLIYGQNWAPQEIEFTFQGDREEDVYVLQSRNMAPRVKRSYPAFRLNESLQASYLGSGIGVSGGALAGLIAFDLENIRDLRKRLPNQPIILLRSDTVPDDIREISIADGILTGRGGATSHAAIVAHRLGKTCVVGFSKMRVWESERRCVIDGISLHAGDTIGIDGQSGAIYAGFHETEEIELPS
ncbi:MAG: hypothetical protein GX443_08700 [Deltaproteobacteria bacterium]|nr:hypothetical protein [Deltaproteobacteria bacterium]